MHKLGLDLVRSDPLTHASLHGLTFDNDWVDNDLFILGVDVICERRNIVIQQFSPTAWTYSPHSDDVACDVSFFCQTFRS
ncbi:hypothetical protein M514_03073 [Trichuris suis]|uniref:Uncharacterized protein n=1 Tax=Trichuris suis TaxID=68888 RepID=A0A085MFF3_9BILA|nr:hypothetical protein M513_03073 [Trichuris suis]KFD68292.1 hypothetical protein M514_03073 [Trichuris suis]